MSDSIYITSEHLALREQVTRYFAEFSHQRASYLWKGMLQIDLFSDDATVKRQFAHLEEPDAPQT